jgi:hypothetical protein
MGVRTVQREMEVLMALGREDQIAGEQRGL